MGFLSEGKKVELEFAKLGGKGLVDAVSFPTTEQDISEHWDVEIAGFKYDVKGLKKIRRSDIYPNELYHYIEIHNVNGDLGWLYGKADYFAFQTHKYFIVVAKDKLQEFIKNNTQKTYVTSADKSLYCLYTRHGRKDIITMVTSIDLCSISFSLLPREKASYDIGDSVIPEIKKTERLMKLGK